MQGTARGFGAFHGVSLMAGRLRPEKRVAEPWPRGGEREEVGCRHSSALSGCGVAWEPWQGKERGSGGAGVGGARPGHLLAGFSPWHRAPRPGVGWVGEEVGCLTGPRYPLGLKPYKSVFN